MREIKIKKYAIIFTFYIVLQLIETMLWWWCADVNDLGMLAIGLPVLVIYPLIALISGGVSYGKTCSLFVPTLLFLIAIFINLVIILYLIKANISERHYIRCAEETFVYVYELGKIALIANFVGALSAKIILFIKSKNKTEDSSMTSKNN